VEDVSDVGQSVDHVARDSQFSGVVRVDHDGEPVFAKAFGFAHRAHAIPNTVDTQFGIASGGKTLTGLTVLSLVADGTLSLTTPARSFLGDDLPLISDDVTVEHLLAHRSGIGDYLDEDEHPDVNEYVMPVSVHELATTEQFLPVLDGHPAKFPAGTQFSYCNGGYVVLALVAERASGVPFHDLVLERVCVPAAMHDTVFPRSDELDGRMAVGYLDVDGLRSNVFHLPVRASGDGGVYSTAADVHALWDAMFAGRVIPLELIGEMIRPRSAQSERHQYGLGVWLETASGSVLLEGADAGASFRSVRAQDGSFVYSVLSNSSRGAGPILEVLGERMMSTA